MGEGDDGGGMGDGGFGGDDGGFGSDGGFGGFGEGFGDAGFGMADAGYGGLSSTGWGTTDAGFSGNTGAGFGGLGSGGMGDSFGNMSLMDSFANMDMGPIGLEGWGTAGFGAPTEGLGSVSNEGMFGDPMSIQDAFKTEEEDNFGKFAKTLQNYAKNMALQSIVAKAGLPSQTLGLLGIAAKGAKNDNAGVGKGFANMGLGMLGNMLGGPIGGLAAASIGNAMGLGSSLGGVTANQGVNGMNGQQDTGLGGMDVAQGLAGLYMGNRANNLYKDQMRSLSDIYSPTGAYAQHLRQGLERKDAAAGRRSQYGPREAQLMGMLANSRANSLTSPGYNAMLQNRERSQNQGLNTMLALLSKSGAGNAIGKSIADLFRGGGAEGGGLTLGNTDFSNMPNFFDNTDLGSIPADSQYDWGVDLFGGQ